ncbi:MAG TPA: alpha/beta fold hydrolase [Bacteroidota bacterium]|nr:alpha/beta fold hydrolase [Bacteroidota bacterium]
MRIKINGWSMNYVERGAPGATPIIFIHGFPFSHDMWEPQMRALPNQFRAIAYDLRGHGQSDVGDGQYNIEFFVDDLVGLMDHLVVERATVCGLSIGGYIALRALERHPDRFHGLVLCDTKSSPDSDEGRIKRAASLRSVKMNGVSPFADEFVKTVFAPATFSAHPEIVEAIRSVIKGTSPLAVGGTLLALAARTDTTASLANIRVPTLILCGEQDLLTPPKESESMHAKIAGSTYRLIPSAAHLSNLENPAVFNDALIAFLKSLPHA